jgi:hypothetical protein
MPRFYADIRVYFETEPRYEDQAAELAHTFASAVMIECPGTRANLWDLKRLGESVPPCPHGFGDDVVCVQCQPRA